MAYRLSDVVNDGGAYTTPGMAVPGGAVGDDWFAQQGAPLGGVTPRGLGFNETPEHYQEYLLSLGGAPVGTRDGYPTTPPGPTGSGRLSNAQAEQFFNQLFPGGTVSPEDLAAHRGELEAAGFRLNPNASGRITDLTLPSGDTVDPIYGAGSGVNRKQWIVSPSGGGGGVG